MMNLFSTRQACACINELVSAKFGKASHGNEAEIYAYTLMPYCPIVRLEKDGKEAMRSLIEIVELFLELNSDCYVEFYGEPYKQFAEKYPIFDHRIKVGVYLLRGGTQ